MSFCLSMIAVPLPCEPEAPEYVSAMSVMTSADVMTSIIVIARILSLPHGNAGGPFELPACFTIDCV